MNPNAAMNPSADLDLPYPLAPEQKAFFDKNGYAKLKDVLSPAAIKRYGPEISRLVKALNKQARPMEERSLYEQAFLQIMNLWTRSEKVKAFVLSKRLAKIAADLLGVRGVRIYHDQALYKEPGGNYTPWHADQYYWPLATDRTVTAWIPLQETPLEMGPLSFAARSQNKDLGRDLPITKEGNVKIQQAVDEGHFEIDESPYELGEVSFHLGWTFHRAGPNTTGRPRAVMTVIYMDADMILAEPKNKNQARDWETWCPGAKIGEPIDTPLNPVAYHGSPGSDG